MQGGRFFCLLYYLNLELRMISSYTAPWLVINCNCNTSGVAVILAYLKRLSKTTQINNPLVPEISVVIVFNVTWRRVSNIRGKSSTRHANDCMSNLTKILVFPQMEKEDHTPSLTQVPFNTGQVRWYACTCPQIAKSTWNLYSKGSTYS